MSEPFALVVTLKGRPFALPRARHIPGRLRPVSRTGKAKAYATALERAVRAAVLAVGDDAVRQAFAGQALSLSALWVFPTLKSERWGRPHTFRPDKDNLEKMLCDCLQRAGGLGGDDSRIALGRTVKQWGPHGWLAAQVEVIAPDRKTAVRHAIQTVRDKLSAPPDWLRG